MLRCARLCGHPLCRRASYCAYSTALRPTPPAAVFIGSRCAVAEHGQQQYAAPGLPACTCSMVMPWAWVQRRQCSGRLASGAWLRPNAERVTASATTPAASPPGGPGSPGYSPSTFNMSRKLSPTARTRKRTRFSPTGPIAGCTDVLLIAPRALKCKRTSPSGFEWAV